MVIYIYICPWAIANSTSYQLDETRDRQTVTSARTQRKATPIHPSSVVGAGAIAGIGLHHERRVVEVAVPWVPAIGGVVEVHGHGGARHQVVRVVARPALLDHGAAHLGARVVEVQRQDIVGRRRLGHAPRFLGCSNTNANANAAAAASYKTKTVPIKQFFPNAKAAVATTGMYWMEHYQSTVDTQHGNPQKGKPSLLRIEQNGRRRRSEEKKVWQKTKRGSEIRTSYNQSAVKLPDVK